MWLLVLSGAGLSLLSASCAHLPGPASQSIDAVSTPASDHDVAASRASCAIDRLKTIYQGSAFVRVVESSKPGAFSWSNGSICLTSALINLSSDEEISAAIAHEMGHLARSHARGADATYALSGPGADEEQRADAIAIVLLRRSGQSPSALVRLLTKVRDAPLTSPELRPALTKRISLIVKAIHD
jgi:hypothetical protein